MTKTTAAAAAGELECDNEDCQVLGFCNCRDGGDYSDAGDDGDDGD